MIRTLITESNEQSFFKGTHVNFQSGWHNVPNLIGRRKITALSPISPYGITTLDSKLLYLNKSPNWIL